MKHCSRSGFFLLQRAVFEVQKSSNDKQQKHLHATFFATYYEHIALCLATYFCLILELFFLFDRQVDLNFLLHNYLHTPFVSICPTNLQLVALEVHLLNFFLLEQIAYNFLLMYVKLIVYSEPSPNQARI